MIVEKVEVSYLLMSMNECNPLLIDCSRWVSAGGSQICKKCRITGHVAIVNNVTHCKHNVVIKFCLFPNDKLTS